MIMTFGEKIRVIMKRKNISVQELAERLGKTRQNINQRLNNSERLTAQEMEQYAAAVGCKISIDIEEIEPEEGESPKG